MSMRSDEPPLEDAPLVVKLPLTMVEFEVIRMEEFTLEVEAVVVSRVLSNRSLTFDNWSSSRANKCCSCAGRRASRLF